MLNLIPWKKRETKPRLFYSPFKEMEDMVNRMFEDFTGDFDSGLSLSKTSAMPSFNMYRQDNNYVIEVSVPGYDKKDITIELQDDFLTIKGEKKEEKEEKNKNYHYREFHTGSFQRSLRLPEVINPEDFKAKYKDGILEIRIPAKEEPEKKSHTINIE